MSLTPFSIQSNVESGSNIQKVWMETDPQGYQAAVNSILKWATEFWRKCLIWLQWNTD